MNAVAAALEPGDAPQEAPVRPRARADGKGKSFLPIETLRRQYIDYLGCKVDEVEEQKQARRYYHGAHYTAAEIRILRERRQPPIVFNRVVRKINGIVGVVERQRQEPKVFPNKPNGEQGAEVASQTIRTVLDGNDWEAREEFCLRQAATDGIAGIELKLVEGDQGDPDIELREVFADDFFYDPTSVRFDFGDAAFKGLAKWVHVEAATELFPEQEEEIRGLLETGSDLTTNADREHKWINTTAKRVRLIEHWYRHRGQWCWAFYIGSVLLAEGVSPFRDERNQSIARFIMFSAAVDHDGDRYGFVRNLKGPQDELNQSRSKGAHIANSRRVISDKGAVDDVETARREWARPDGWIEKNPGRDIAPDNTAQTDLAAQIQRYQTASEEIDQFANVNVASMTQGDVGNLSGVAINLLQQPGFAELGPFVRAYRGWLLRVYRAIWNMAQQYWTSERWIRVTRDQKLAQFIQINGLDLDEHGRPALVNYLGALDVDVKIDQGPDVVTAMQDTLQVLKGYPPGMVPPQVLIKLSPIPGSDKDEILQMLQPPVDPAQGLAKQLMLEQASAQVDKTKAEAIEKRAKATTDVARAAHLASDAHLSAIDVYTRGMQAANQSAAQGPGQQQRPAPSPPAQIGPSGQSVTAPPTQPIPFSGARLAPDGHHYVFAPHARGNYMRVLPGGLSAPAG